MVAPQVVVMATCGATSDDKVGIMTALGFPCLLNLKQKITTPFIVKADGGISVGRAQPNGVWD